MTQALIYLRSKWYKIFKSSENERNSMIIGEKMPNSWPDNISNFKTCFSLYDVPNLTIITFAFSLAVFKEYIYQISFKQQFFFQPNGYMLFLLFLLFYLFVEFIA